LGATAARTQINNSLMRINCYAAAGKLKAETAAENWK